MSWLKSSFAVLCWCVCNIAPAHAGAKMLMLDQQTKRADIPFTPLSAALKPQWLGKLAYDPGYFKIVAHTYVIRGAEGDMYCGFTGNSWVKEQSSILLTATARGIDAIPSPLEVPIYTRDTTSDGPICTGAELSVADVMPFTLMKDADDQGTIYISFKYSDNKNENLSNLATQTISIMQAFNPATAAAAVLPPLTNSAMQTMSSSYGKITGVSATDWVTLPIDFKALREGIDSWSIQVQLAERSMGSSFIDIINNPEKYQKKIRPVLRVEFKVVYAPSVFTRETEWHIDGQYYPKIDPFNKNIIAVQGNTPVAQPSLQMRLNADSPSAIVKLAREASCSATLQTGCDDIRKIIDPAPLTLLDKAIWYNAALSQVNENWGTDSKFMKSNCITAGPRDYAAVLDAWFPGTVNIIRLQDVEYARRTPRPFTQSTQKLFPQLAHALIQTQNSPQQADVELKDLLDDNIVLRPMTNLLAENLAERRGIAEVSPVLSQFKVKQVGCFYQAPYQIGQSEGFMIYTLNERADPLRALVKFGGGKITDITLQDLNSNAYRGEILDQEWQTQSTCKTQIIPALQQAERAMTAPL
ncbi:MAG: hypothetical protein JWM78_3561 [Verrucomicrobiaceae bacterium]|nr:hypothetical protein [Verrucomicrobiaceae bacterium]